MKKSTSTQSSVSEGVRNMLVVIAIFGAIAFITYLEWSNRLN